MYRIAGVLFFLLLIFSGGCISDTLPPDETETYVVGIDRYYPPFTYIDTDDEPAGFDVESVKWIAGQKEFGVEFKSYAWNELIPALESGEVDMLYTGLIVTPERNQTIDFSIPYWETGLSVAVRENSSITMEDVYQGNATIGFVLGTTTEGWLKENIPDYGERLAGGLILGYNSFALSIVGLQNNGCDAVIFDSAGMPYLIQDKPVKVLGVIDTDSRYAIGVRKGDKELRELMNSGLTELMQSGEWQELTGKYFS
jgi:polar amino acid transport system substrate-binding protein